MNDTIRYFNSNDSIERFYLTKIDTSMRTGCILDFTSHDIMFDFDISEGSAKDDYIVILSKSPGVQNGLKSELSVFLKDFYGSIESNNEFTDLELVSLEVRGILIDSLIEIRSNYTERKSKPNDVTHIYWSKQCGLSAYKTYNNDVWVNHKVSLNSISPQGN
ncbi:MAG: hypothetical protein AAF740_10755 [Bacteroidota bacterium]